MERHRHPLRPDAHDDQGIALVVTVALMALVAVLSVVMVTVAIRESGSSGRDRQRSSAVMTAEGQVDTLVARIHRSAASALPCGGAVPPATVGADTLRTTTAVTYYDASGATLACPPSTLAAHVKIRATTTSDAVAGHTPATRTVETLLRLRPNLGNTLSQAIYGDVGVTLARGEVFGDATGVPNGNVYTNGNIHCKDQTYHGSIYAQGTVSTESTCIIDVDVLARTGFTGSSTGQRVYGKIESSQGSIGLGGMNLPQVARASGTVTGSNCTPTKCIGGQALAHPPVPAFPQVKWDDATRAQWVAAGYTVVEKNGCTAGTTDNPGKWLHANAASLAQDTVLRTTCTLQLYIGENVRLAKSLAVVANGGMSFDNNVTVESTNGGPRNFYLIQPYDAVSTHPCTTHGILFKNQFNVTSSVTTLLYSPCNVTMLNHSAVYGQIYSGGKVAMLNEMSLHYRATRVHGTASSVEHYDVDVLYKRETTS